MEAVSDLEPQSLCSEKKLTCSREPWRAQPGGKNK